MFENIVIGISSKKCLYHTVSINGNGIVGSVFVLSCESCVCVEVVFFEETEICVNIGIFGESRVLCEI